MTNPGKPNFRREDRNKKVRLKGKWRKPKGIHSKMRHGFRGRAPVVAPGYRIPVDARGKDAKGRSLVLVSSMRDLEGLASSSAVIIASTVGARLRISLIDAAEKGGLSIVNIKKPSEYKAKVAERLAQNKAARQQRAKAKEAKKEKKPAEKAEEAKTEEQKKEDERAEQEKVLTQRQ